MNALKLFFKSRGNRWWSYAIAAELAACWTFALLSARHLADAESVAVSYNVYFQIDRLADNSFWTHVASVETVALAAAFALALYWQSRSHELSRGIKAAALVQGALAIVGLLFVFSINL